MAIYAAADIAFILCFLGARESPNEIGLSTAGGSALLQHRQFVSWIQVGYRASKTFEG
jgi:hypothetical protein